jgi:hypothetical protein
MIAAVRGLPRERFRAMLAIRWAPGRLTVAGAYLLGAALMVESDHAAAAGLARPAVLGMLALGVIVVVLITAAVLAGTRASFGQRVLLVSVFGAVGVMPKLLRSPSGPIYFDELAHFRQAHDLAVTGVVGAPNSMIPIISAFPGLHDLTASIVQLSGLSTWTVAEVVVTLCHMAMTLGVFVVVRLALPEDLDSGRACRIAGIATVVYALNPEWMFFDSMFAYETLALPFAFWAVAAALAAARTHGRRRRTATAVAVVLAFATATTHHVTSAILTGVLVLVYAGVAIRRRAGDVRYAIGAAMLVCGVVLGWLVSSSGRLNAYLGPYASSAGSQATTMFGGSAGSTGRSLSQSLLTIPQLPRLFAFAGLITPFAIIAICAIVIAAPAVLPRIAGRTGVSAAAWWSTPGTVMLTALAIAYAATLPLLLTPAGNQLVRRSWAWSWIGVGFVLAIAVEACVHGEVGRRWPAAGVGAVLLTTMAAAALVSGVAYGLEEPMPYMVGNDASVRNTELLALSRWTRSAVPGRRITTDRYTAMALTAYGEENWVTPLARDPLWSLVGSASSAHELAALRSEHVAYVVVDDRMATTLPASRFWYEHAEPAWVHDRLVPPSHLRRFDCLPFTHAVYSSAHYTVYRVDVSAYNASAERRVVAWLGRRDHGEGTGAIDRRTCP